MFREWLCENDITSYDFSHPLYEKASNRGFWEKLADPSVIKKAEENLGYTAPAIKASYFMEFEKSGDRMIMENPYHEKRRMLCTFALAEIFEHKGRFIPDLVDLIFSVCEESFWGLSAHRPPIIRKQNIPDPKDAVLDLFSCETAANIAIIYYILYDELKEYCPEILKRMKDEFETRILRSFLKETRYFWQGYVDKNVNNWNPWILSNILTALLLFWKKNKTFYRCLEKIFYEIDSIYNSYLDDGGCDEGITYWTASGLTFFEFCEHVYLATDSKLNFFEDEKVKKVLSYPYKAYIGGDRFVNFADGGCFVGTEALPLGVLYLIGKRTGDKNFFALANERRNMQNVRCSSDKLSKLKRTINNLIYYDEALKQNEPFEFKNHYFEKLQASFIRRDKWFYAAKGGHNAESHNHNDVGSFICSFDNKPVLVDSGNAVYTKKTFSDKRYEIWTNQSSFHNLPEINGEMQLAGYTKRADAFSLEGLKTKISYKNAYPESAGLSSLKRSVEIKGGIEVCDVFEFEKDKNKVSQNLLTCCEAEIFEDKIILDKEFVVTASLPFKAEITRLEFEGDKVLMTSWKKGWLNRISLKFDLGKNAEIKLNIRRGK